jgi:hypothetical protein
MISKSWASNQLGPSRRPPRLGAVPASEVVPMGGSLGTDFNGSGVTPRCNSNRADGRHGRERDARLIEP